jgi:hypothetical protein
MSSTWAPTSADYVQREHRLCPACALTVQTLQAWGRYQVVDRSHVPNFVFAADDIVVALGQDGLVANTMKYLDGQPLDRAEPGARPLGRVAAAVQAR